MPKALTSGGHEIDDDLAMQPQEHGNFGFEVLKFGLQKYNILLWPCQIFCFLCGTHFQSIFSIVTRPKNLSNHIKWSLDNDI